MKVLLAIAMTTALMGTAFGACSTSSPKECTTAADCTKLSVQDGPQYTMQATKDGQACMLKDTAIATNCTENPNSGRTAGKDLGTPADAKAPAANGTVGK